MYISWRVQVCVCVLSMGNTRHCCAHHMPRSCLLNRVTHPQTPTNTRKHTHTCTCMHGVYAWLRLVRKAHGTEMGLNLTFLAHAITSFKVRVTTDAHCWRRCSDGHTISQTSTLAAAIVSRVFCVCNKLSMCGCVCVCMRCTGVCM